MLGSHVHSHFQYKPFLQKVSKFCDCFWDMCITSLQFTNVHQKVCSSTTPTNPKYVHPRYIPRSEVPMVLQDN